MYRKLKSGAIVFLAGAVAGALVMTMLSPPRAEGENADVACRPGDLNADGDVNVSDAVHLLLHLFRTGPAPRACDPSCGSGYFINRLDAATFVVVRHAERGAGADPGLNDVGVARARRLGELLADAPVTHLIASDLRRTQETLAPLADTVGLPVEQIADEEDVVMRLESLDPGALAVVAHHSFTIHDILEGLGLDGVRSISVSGSNHDNLFVVVRPFNDALRTQMVHLKY